MNMKVKMKFYIVLLNLLLLFTAVDAQPVLQYLHEGWLPSGAGH